VAALNHRERAEDLAERTEAQLPGDTSASLAIQLATLHALLAIHDQLQAIRQELIRK
jgi:hypothetical protein